MYFYLKQKDLYKVTEANTTWKKNLYKNTSSSYKTNMYA
jgi:hypothetical protein